MKVKGLVAILSMVLLSGMLVACDASDGSWKLKHKKTWKEVFCNIATTK